MPSSRHNRKFLAIAAVGMMAAVCLGAAASTAPSASAQSAGSQAPASSPANATQPVDFQAFYEARLAEIRPDDANALYSLALLCSNRQRPDLAAEVSRKILASWPAHSRAKMLLRASTLRMATMTQPTAPATRPVMDEPPLAIPGVLNQTGINRIRFHEFHVDDMSDRLRVRIPKLVLQEFVAQATKDGSMSERDWNLFHRADNDDKLRWIIKKSDGEMYVDHIKVDSEPRSMTLFRQRVWPIISRSCATPNCHGGDKAGHLRYVLPITYGPAMTTNFYIASRFEAGEGRLIDRETPEASLLLQFGLPADQAQWRHPVAITPAYSSPNDPKYQIVLEWIRQLRTPAPDYGITESMWQPFPTRPSTSQAAANR